MCVHACVRACVREREGERVSEIVGEKKRGKMKGAERLGGSCESKCGRVNKRKKKKKRRQFSEMVGTKKPLYIFKCKENVCCQ